jgi:hypothetical protein
MILEAYELAITRGQAAGALRAVEMLGQELHGMFKGHTQTDQSAGLRELSDAALLEVLDRNLALLGLPTTNAGHPAEATSAVLDEQKSQNH